MKLKELAEKLELKAVTQLFDKEVTGVYISEHGQRRDRPTPSPGTCSSPSRSTQRHRRRQPGRQRGHRGHPGQQPAPDVVKMAEKAQIAIFTTPLNQWQVATKLYECGIR